MNRKLILCMSMIMVLCSGCHDNQQNSHSETLLNKVSHATKSYVDPSLTSEHYLHGVKKIQVEGYENQSTFFVEERTQKITQFPCMRCHNQPLKKMKNKNSQRAHWNMKLKHADSSVMSCTTCHDQKQLDKLTLLTGKQVSFNHSYQQCAQCHFQQAKDWGGGAHGKRLGGWAKPRVVMSCTACHNPHEPGFHKRWPSIISKVPGEIK